MFVLLLLCFRFSFLKIHMFDNEQLIHEKHELGFPRKLLPFYHFAKKRFLVISPYEIGKIFAIYIVGKISQKMMFAKFRVNEETLISRSNNYLKNPYLERRWTAVTVAFLDLDFSGRGGAPSFMHNLLLLQRERF